MPTFTLTPLDIGAVVIYALLIFGIGLYFSRKTDDGEDYFLAGRSLTWGLIGISLLASNLSSSSMIGMRRLQRPWALPRGRRLCPQGLSLACQA
ncbi:MAG: hypothetical protein AAFP18_17790, partial [Bacteroidota bacterium]